MISADEVREIIRTYEKHGWALRRVLLSKGFNGDPSVFKGTPVEDSDLDALWFTRASNKGTAWELRHLGPSPLAFLTVIDDAGTDADERIADTEERLRSAVHRKR